MQSIVVVFALVFWPPPPPRQVIRVCGTCGHQIWVDQDVTPHHREFTRDRQHRAKLTNADLRIIVDGLRMSD